MDKAVLKKFAIESRQDLMQRMENKIKTFYIDEEFSKQQSGDVYILANSKHSLNLSKEEYTKRELLIKRINELGLDQVIEEAAYTWFNRIVAIRYMEIHDYLPLTRDNQSLGIRVLSSKDNTLDPEIMKFTNLVNPDLDINFKKEKYVELKDDNEKFKYILLLVCKKLGRVIPQVFDGITDYIDILVPDNLLNESGFINKIITEVPVENYERVEIIGWLYQYYNQTEKDKVMASNKAYKKNEIPYATQLFTPDWIVKYLVENSLGRYWIEHSGNLQDSIINDWKYFDNENIKIKNGKVDPRLISFLDPCCGSGHILVYAFDLFYQIYQMSGFNKNDIPKLILLNNLYGLDIDDRAGQLSILSILLKAREYDSKIYNKVNTQDINIMSIPESNNIESSLFYNLSENNIETIKYLLDSLKDAKEIGSLLKLQEKDYSQLENEITNNDTIFTYVLKNKVKPLIKFATILTQKYDIIVTNPPYMNISNMSLNLKKYLNKYYPDSKSDLCTAFMELKNLKQTGYIAIINQHSWMFLVSFEKLREKIINNYSIINMIHLGTRAFEEISGEVVQTTAFIMSLSIEKEKSIFYRLLDIKNAEQKEKRFLELKTKQFDNKCKFEINQSKLNLIPEVPIAYWISNKLINIFDNIKLSNISNVKKGISTSDNERFLRIWFEINKNKFSIYNTNFNNIKWFPLNKGGLYRKWYGNNDYVINWENNGFEIKNFKPATIRNESFYFKESLTWTDLTTGKISFRYNNGGFIHDVAGPCVFDLNSNTNYILGLLNSNVISKVLEITSPTMHYNIGSISNLPIIVKQDYISEVTDIVKNNVYISKEDWDSFETSWNFTTHPLIEYKEGYGYSSDLNDWSYKIKDAYESWKLNCDEKFKLLKNNEEELNRIFIDIYGLNKEIIPKVDDKDITIRKADRLREVKSLISYTVGCMFGRYSLDEDGLIYAGGEFDESRYKKFKADSDNIIPITDEAYFDDDIVQRFKQFIEVSFGKETLNENLDFIAETLGKKGTETSEETIRRYFVNDFFNDHCKIYQKRPIYWLLDSGKKNGFKALIYMHRYDESLIPRARINYLHRVQTTYENLLSDINYKLTTDLSMVDKKNTLKRQADLNAKIQEIKEYDEKIAHIANQRISIDLDDGVKVNYEKFKDILAKIK